jgi:hypothetical protein
MSLIESSDYFQANTPAEPGGDDAVPFPDEARPSLAANLRERTIPIRNPDLQRLLLADPDLDPPRRAEYEKLFRLITSILHHDFHAQLLHLKELYSPLDPDCDCVRLDSHSPVAGSGGDEAFLQPFEHLLERANYRPLSLEHLKEAVAEPNELGLNYVPNFDLFEHLRVWVRGHTEVARKARSLRTRFRRRVVTQPAYQRMVVCLKFKPGKHLGDFARSDVVYLRMFKDVPHVDMEMHLPEQGTKVKMRMIDKAQIASPMAVGIPSIALKLMAASIFTLSTSALGTLLVAPISAGVNSFFGFQRAKQKHLHYMIRHLYYLTLANNASVICRLVDMAEEEEAKEAVLAYYLLGRPARDGEPWTVERLDSAIETLLRERAGVGIDFEIGDALAKIFRLGLIGSDSHGHLSALTPSKALALLDRRWDDYYQSSSTSSNNS